MSKLVTTQERRKLPKMEYENFVRLVSSGIFQFHNGGTRKRTVIGLGSWVSYKSNLNSKTTVSVTAGAFIGWCKGYVKDGIMYDVAGKELKGASEDGQI